MERILIADVGSTTTKAILFVRDRAWSFHRREAPTTVEAPHADVRVGLRASLRALEAETGETLLDGDRPAVDLLLTSSAGGGLAMVVTGLVRRVTSLSAERAALGAGAILLDTIALDDGRVPYEKLEALTSLRPDMLLFAGGFDGDAIAGPVFLAEIVRQADLRPKLTEDARLPVVYAGNVNAADLVRDTLEGRYLFRQVPNLRPESDRENLEPARNEIHGLFMDHVMSHAPGYRGLAPWVSGAILPTPSAVARLLETVTEGSDERVLVVDVGGATTDVYTARRGRVFRTVSANLGMSYSLLNVVRTAGLGAIRVLLDFEIDPDDLLNRLGNKHLEPTRLPADLVEMKIEWAAAAVAVRHAVMEHSEVMRGAPLSFDENDLAISALVKRRRNARAVEKTIHLEGYDLVVGSGGIFSHSPREAAAATLLSALRPVGAVDLAVDSAFMFPHLGVLSRSDPGLAVELYRALALAPLGTAICSRGEGIEVAGETNSGRLLRERAGAGELVAVPLEEGETVELAVRGAPVRRAVARGGPAGILLDARGLADPRTPFVSSPPPPPPPRVPIEESPPIETGVLRERRELAVPGDVAVAPDDRVETDDLVARCVRTFPRPFFLRPREALKVPPEEVAKHLLVAEGDEVEADQVLARRTTGKILTRTFRSPVAGRVERILPDGTIVFREAEAHATEKVAVQVGKDLGIEAHRVARYVAVEVGQEVDRGQALAKKLSSDGYVKSPSPVRGTVERIDREFGIVLVAPLREELEVLAWLPGRVVEVTERGAVIEGPATLLRGAWGVGGEAAGPLALDRLERGHVAAIPSPTARTLPSAVEAGVVGLVTGGLDLAQVREVSPPFPVVLLEGFGRREIGAGARNALSRHRGRLALIDGTTVLRVGVRRPRLILPG